MIENNNIPKHWQVKRLGEVCEKVEAVKRKEKNPKDELLYFDIGGIDNNTNKIVSFKNYRWEDAPSRAQQIVFTDDVLFSTVRTYMKNIALVENKQFEGQIASSGFCVIRANKKILSPKFIFHYLLTNQFLQPLNKLQTGSSYPAVRDKDVFTQPLPLPPLPEQHAIVSKIEELFSELDSGKQQLQTALQQLKVYRQSLLKWAFEGKLTNKKVKEDELPQGWKLVRLAEVSKISGGLTKNAKRQSFELQLPFLRVANVYYNSLELTEIHTIGIKENEIERVRLEKVDLLFVEGNGSIEQIGRVALWNGAIENCVHQNHLIKSRLSIQVVPKFALYFFCSKIGRDRIKEQANSTSGLHTLSLSKISKLQLPLPPLEEQQRIVQELESKLTVCDKIEETITQSLLQAETLKQSILKKAFEGKLVETAPQGRYPNDGCSPS